MREDNHHVLPSANLNPLLFERLALLVHDLRDRFVNRTSPALASIRRHGPVICDSRGEVLWLRRNGLRSELSRGDSVLVRICGNGPLSKKKV